ncbi:MAG TPA: ThiF family adenylyltransferase [Pseudonocardiaceae bacterium]
MTGGWSLVVPPPAWDELCRHLFADGGRHAAVLLAERAFGPRGPRLLVRDLVRAADGLHYARGTHDYRSLRAEFLRDTAVRARDAGLAHLVVRGSPDADFGPVELASHERGFPALSAIVGDSIGAVVIAGDGPPDAANGPGSLAHVAGDLWHPGGDRTGLAELVVPGAALLRLRSAPEAPPRLRVAVVGLGGTGTAIAGLLARTNVVSELVLVDHRPADDHLLPRSPAARTDDVGVPRVEVAARAAVRHRNVTIVPVGCAVTSPVARAALAGCDWIFLADPAHAARHQVNDVVHRYLVPATQVGVAGVADPHVVVRALRPGRACLWCEGLVEHARLAADVPGTPADRADAGLFVGLDALAAAEAVTQFLIAVGHAPEGGVGVTVDHVLHRPAARSRHLVRPRHRKDCRACRPARI